MNLFFNPVKIFATQGSDVLARDICTELQTRLPRQLQPNERIVLSDAKVTWFPNQNPEVQVENVRGHFVVVVHTQAPDVSRNFLELLAMLHAISDAHPADVMILFPYMPFSRSDRKDRPRISVMSKLLADILSKVYGIKRVLLMDPHDPHIKHYFDPSADEISSVYLLADDIERTILKEHRPDDCVLVFADNGAPKRDRKIKTQLNLRTAYIDKERTDPDNPRINEVIGDVRGKVCIVFDDEILSGGTAVQDSESLLFHGAIEVHVRAVHGILMGDKHPDGRAVVGRLEESRIASIAVTNSVPVQYKLQSGGKIGIIRVEALLAEAVKRVAMNESLTDLHDPNNISLYRKD